MTNADHASPGLVIGVDFDNTLASYDELFHRVALEHGLIEAGSGRSKKDVQKAVRSLPDGETSWQKLQAEVYGPRMEEAELTPGAADFLARCSRQQAGVYIVSHKTRFAGYDTTNTDLRRSSLDWMSRQGFFGPGGPGLTLDRVFFESTREEKLARIKQLGCSYFIDDLEEVFGEASFPPRVCKILYAPAGQPEGTDATLVAKSWDDVARHIWTDGN